MKKETTNIMTNSIYSSGKPKLTEIIQKKSDLKTYYISTDENTHGFSRVECQQDVKYKKTANHTTTYLEGCEENILAIEQRKQ